jgi:hypothetical protein
MGAHRSAEAHGDVRVSLHALQAHHSEVVFGLHPALDLRIDLLTSASDQLLAAHGETAARRNGRRGFKPDLLM